MVFEFLGLSGKNDIFLTVVTNPDNSYMPMKRERANLDGVAVDDDVWLMMTSELNFIKRGKKSAIGHSLCVCCTYIYIGTFS